MRSHAQASSAGSIEGAGSSRSLFGRTLAIRGASGEADGSGAPSIVRMAGLLALALVALLALGAPSAFAGYATVDTFSGPGVANGQLEKPGRMAIEASTDNVLVADGGNNRVQVLDSEGQYLTSFGSGALTNPVGIAIDQGTGDVYVTSGTNEVQTVYFRTEPASGTFTLSLEGQTTGPIAYGASAAVVQTELEGLSTIGVGNVAVYGGDYAISQERRTYTVTFRAPPAGPDVEQMTLDSSGVHPIDPNAPPGTQTISNGAAGKIVRYTSDGQPTPTYTLDPSFTSPTQGLGLGQVGDFEAAIAVDPTSGDLLVADKGNHRIARYGSDGTFLSSFDGADSGAAFISPLDLAIDSTGDIIVLDATGTLREVVRETATSRVLRFASAGVFEGQPGSANVAGLVAVDPDNDNVIIMGNFDSITSGQLLSVSIFAPDGNGLAGGQLSSASKWAVGTGLAARGGGSERIYAITGFNPVVPPIAGAVGGEILEDVEPATAVVEPATEVEEFSATLHGTVNPHGAETKYRFEYATAPTYDNWTPVGPDQSAGAGSADVPVSAQLTGLADEAFYFFRVVASNAGGGETTPEEIFATPNAEVPAVTVAAATGITKTGATLHGTVDAEGVPTTYRFEYSIDDGANWTPAPVPDVDAGDGADPVDVETPITVDPNTLVRYRLAAKNGAGASTSAPDQTFTTPEDAPGAVTGAASDRTATGATLRGSVNPFGLQTTYHFEYGTTTAYGSRVPLGSEAVAGNGHKALSVSHAVTGLAPEATYHFRIVASNAIGESQGEDHTFTTGAAALGEGRAYELVSPADKGTGNVLIAALFHGGPDGDWLAFAGKGALGGSEVTTEGSPQFPRYIAKRGASGWTSVGIDPPNDTTYLQSGVTQGFSEDGTKAMVVSTYKLAPGAVEGDSNVYLRDTATGAYTTILTQPGTTYAVNAMAPLATAGGIFLGGNSDFSHVLLFGDTSSLLPGAPQYANYEWSDGELRLASVAPGGSPIAAAMMGSHVTEGMRDPRFVSEDGSTVALLTQQSSEGSSNGGPIWVRVDGTTTLPVSVSQRSSDPGTPNSAAYAGMTRDGDSIFIISANLTDDSTPGVYGLYRFDVDSGQLTLLTTAGGKLKASSWLQTTDDGTVFLRAGANLAVWRGQLFEAEGAGVAAAQRIASVNGKYYAFKSTKDGQIYRYDVEADTLACASCGAEGPAVGGDPLIDFVAGTLNIGGHHSPQAVDDSGDVFFDTFAPLVPSDANSTRDVYSFDGDQVKLISLGSSYLDSQFADATPDGKNVYFTTLDRLVGIDTDDLIDVYDARLGGGIAAQNPPQDRGECIRDDCKATPNVGPELPFGGSEGLSGPGNVAAPAKPRCGKGRHKQKVKGKWRCVKQQKQNKRHNNRRQGR